MSNVITFTPREHIVTSLRREPIAAAGLRPSVEVVGDIDDGDWVIVEALVPRRCVQEVVPAIWSAVHPGH